MNGSLYAMLVYLVLYLQDDRGYSALNTGLRLLAITAGSLVAATIAGRLSSHMPVRWLIGPGLLLVGVGLVLMAGINGLTSWTHLVPGFVVAGVGSGMVNPPLASTAVGVVSHTRSGMASGVNTTFRQIGIATGIAVYGSIFTAQLTHNLTAHLARTPALAGHAGAIESAMQKGAMPSLIGRTSASVRPALVEAMRASFASTLDVLFVVSACVALVGAIAAASLIRSKDFVAVHPPPTPNGAPEATLPGVGPQGLEAEPTPASSVV